MVVNLPLSRSTLVDICMVNCIPLLSLLYSHHTILYKLYFKYIIKILNNLAKMEFVKNVVGTNRVIDVFLINRLISLYQIPFEWYRNIVIPKYLISCYTILTVKVVDGYQNTRI